MPAYQVFPDHEHLAEAAASHIMELGNQAIDSHGIFTFALSGGATPRSVYKRMSLERQGLNWSKVHVFWGDERCIPPDDPHSNYFVAWETLLAHVPIPAENIHRIRGELQSPEAAEIYQRHLLTFFMNHPALTWCDVFPSFDLILLGMGEDGHTASLFPGSPALEEASRWVVSVKLDHPFSPPIVERVTFSLPLINAGKNILFLVSGEGKAQRLKQVLAREADPPLPAQRVQPVSGRLIWMVDRQAASRLSNVSR